MFSTSYIEISKSNYKKNLKFIKSQIGDQALFSSVIKGNAYGHGIENMVEIAEWAGIRHFSTFSADEALRALKSSHKKSEIMIMGMISNEELAWAIEHGVSFFVFDRDRLEQAIKLGQKMGKKAKIHLEAETGFHRTGFELKEMEKVCDLLKGCPEAYTLEGLCMHFAGAESIGNYFRIQQQIKSFTEFEKLLQRLSLKPKHVHMACSAAALTYKDTVRDMVRIGIAQYGFWPSPETYMHMFKEIEMKNKNPLRRLITWKSSVMSTKEVQKGEFIGYGNSYMASTKMEIAIVPVGYAHGYSRSLSNTGKVLIRGRMAPVVGTVTMNAIAVDVTGFTVEKGDEVVLIGKQGKAELTVASFGESSSQVNYELLTRLPDDIPRFIVK